LIALFKKNPYILQHNTQHILNYYSGNKLKTTTKVKHFLININDLSKKVLSFFNYVRKF